MKIKTFVSCFIFCVSVASLIYADSKEDLNSIAYRIAGRAEIIRDRVETCYEESPTKTPDLYYFLINTLYDSYGLYTLGDIENARSKLFAIDSITYDLICTGVSAVVELNQDVRNLQKSMQAGKVKNFQELIAQRLGSVTRPGLFESVQFTKTEEQYFAALTQQLFSISRELDDTMTPQTLLSFFEKHELIDKRNVRFSFPDSLQVPVTGFVFGVTFNNNGAMLPQLYLKSPEVSKATVLFAVANLIAFKEGFGVNNNESLESQIHYVLLEMRLCDWIVQKYLQLGLDNVEELEQWRAWYQNSYERLVEESFEPGYYKQLFNVRELPSLHRVKYDWDKSSQQPSAINSPSADDYIFHLIGNGSQMPPNKNLVAFFDAHADEIEPGIAFDLGSGDGANSLFLAANTNFSRVVAVDHSQVAINRIKQLSALEKDGEKIQPVKQNILQYKYPNERTPLLQRASFILIDDVLGYLAPNERISLISMLKNAMRDGAFIFIEVHLAEGEKYESFKQSDLYEVTDNNVVISKNEYQGEQKKEFFTRQQLQQELASSGIVQGDQFDLKSETEDQADGFVSQTIIIRKK